MWKKCFVLLALFVLVSRCFAQSSLDTNISTLEDYVINLENESLTQKILIENLQIQLQDAKTSQENLTTQLAEISKQQEMQSNSLKKSEFKCKVLGWSLGISLGMTITSIGIMCLVLNNK